MNSVLFETAEIKNLYQRFIKEEIRTGRSAYPAINAGWLLQRESLLIVIWRAEYF